MIYIELNDLSAIGDALESGVRVEAQVKTGYWIDVTESRTINLDFIAYRINTESRYDELKKIRMKANIELNHTNGRLIELYEESVEAVRDGDNDKAVIINDDIEWVQQMVEDQTKNVVAINAELNSLPAQQSWS